MSPDVRSGHLSKMISLSMAGEDFQKIALPNLKSIKEIFFKYFLT